MPQHVQFKKTLKKSEGLNKRNTAAESRMKSYVKKVMLAKSKEEAETALRTAVSVIDSTARRGIIKKSTAARKKSRLFHIVAKMQ